SPAGPMRMWPISTGVNKFENDDSSTVERIELVPGAAFAQLTSPRNVRRDNTQTWDAMCSNCSLHRATSAPRRLKAGVNSVAIIEGAKRYSGSVPNGKLSHEPRFIPMTCGWLERRAGRMTTGSPKCGYSRTAL